MKISVAEVDVLVNDTTRFLVDKAPGRNGFIRKLFFWDTQRWLEFNKPDDIGDHLTYIAAAQRNLIFARTQYGLWKRRMIDGLPYPHHKIPLPPMLEAQNVDDFLHGLWVLQGVFGDEEFLRESVRVAGQVSEKLQMASGVFATTCIPYLHLPLPSGCSPLKPSLRKNYFADAPSNGLIAEKMIEIGVAGKQETLVKAAQKCLDAWLATRLFRTYGVFPTEIMPENVQSTHLMKSNSNLGFALVASAKQGNAYHKEMVGRLIDSLHHYFSLDLGYSNVFTPADAGRKGRSLIATHAYCRLLMAAAELGHPALRKKAADIAFKVMETALDNDSAWSAELYEDDGQGDFAVLLMILDRHHAHNTLMSRIFKDIRNKYYLGDGIWKDYIGENRQRTSHTKFIGGLLKYLLCYKAYLNKEDLDVGKWRYLLQDR